MNSERFTAKKHEKATTINAQVDTFFEEHPRSKKSHGDIAQEIVKDEASRIPYREIPEEHREWFANMQNAGVRVLEDGFLEISRWDNTGKHAGKPKLMKQKVDGLLSAIRMQDHILEGYRSGETTDEDEYAKLESMEEVITYANDVLNEWKDADAEVRKELQQRLADVVLRLELCRNEFKIDAREQAEAVMKLKDSKNRENPSALAARTVAALNDLTGRMNEMQLIAPLIALRKEILVLEKRRVEGVLRKASTLLSAVLHHSVFAEKKNSSPDQRIKEHEIDMLDKNLGKVLYSLDTLYIAPQHQQAEQVKALVTDTKKFFRSKQSLVDNLDTIRETLKEAQEILAAKVEDFG